MSFLKRLTLGKFSHRRVRPFESRVEENQQREGEGDRERERDSGRENKPSLLPRSSSIYDERTVGAAQSSNRIVLRNHEETNQQIRVLNLNRRPNINSRPLSVLVLACSFGFARPTENGCPPSRVAEGQASSVASVVVSPRFCAIQPTAVGYERASERAQKADL